MNKYVIRWLLSLALILTVCCSCFLPVHASGDNSTDKPTKAEIQQMWRAVTSATELYDEKPSVSDPYKAGKLDDAFLQTGLTMANYVRFVANLPLLQLDDTINEDAQYGAVLLAAEDDFGHHPAQPADMSDEFYQRGLDATSSSNIHCNYGYAAKDSLKLAVSGFMDDEDESNNSRVGHRRWILNPTLQKIGFGFAQSSSWNYVTMKVFDRSGSAVDYNFIAWPAEGNFPTNLITTEVPWSITLNPERYQTPERSQLKITLTRKSDNKIWKFDSTTGTPGDPAYAFLHVDTSNRGVSNCIIFNPGSDNIDKYMGIFSVDVSGIYNADGTAATLHYEVDFFDVTQCVAHEYDVIETKATCTTDGFAEKTCIYCGYETTEIIPARGHSWSEAQITSEPTCTEKGVQERTCISCGIRETTEISALGHNYADAMPIFNEKTRTHSDTCVRCGKEKIENCTFEMEVLDEATLNNLGIREYTCTVCGGSYEETYVCRISGSSRYDTGYAVADALKAQLGVEEFDNIIVASGLGYADALAASYLAAVKEAPILLVNERRMEEVADYIRENLANDGMIYLIGGEGAIPVEMEEILDGFNMKRLSGKNRYETNMAILEEAGTEGQEILVCTGRDFPDSLSASAVGKPILLVNKTLYDYQKEFLENSSGEFVIIGGTGAVTEELEAELSELGQVTRLGGSGRYETCVMVAEYFFPEGAESAIVAYSRNFPDGLCGGPLAYAMNAPLLLLQTDRGPEVIEYANETGIKTGAVLGGASLIDDATVNKVFVE